MRSPLRQFLIISLIGVTVTLLSLLYFHVQLTEDYLREHLDAHNKNLSVVLRNSLLVSGLEQELVGGGNELSAPMIENISSILGRELNWVPIVKVKIYSRDGIVLFSSKTEEIGEDETDNPGVQGALIGTPVSGQVEAHERNEFDDTIEIEDLHQQYVPIESRQSGDVIGVFESYLNIREVVRSVEARQRAMLWLIGGILGAFYLALAITFFRTNRLLQSESQQRQAHLDELKAMHSNLEQRVQERTAELDHAKNFLQLVIDGIPNRLLVIRPDFTIALMNQKARSLIPPGQDETDYRYCYQVAHGLSEPCTKPDHPCSFAEVMAKGCPITVRHSHYDADNNPVIVDLLTSPFYSEEGEFAGVIEVEHDVTQMVQMQAGLEESKAHLQATMDNVPDAILTCDSEYIIQSCNRSALSLFHGKESDLLGKNLAEIFFDEVGVNALKSEIPAQQQTILKRVHGKEFPADLWIGPLGYANGDTRYIVVVRDVTSRIKAQRELETTRQQYFHQEKMAAIGELAAGILHEVGNPIAAISGAAAEVKYAYESDMDGDYVSKNIDLINEQITRLGKITREISDFASPKPRERELLDLNGLLSSTARLLTYDRRFSSIGVALELDKNLPAIVGVADQLTQVFMNLLINAMDACVSLEWEKDSIVLSSELAGDKVHVCVRDHGSGMSTETLEHVMETFYTTKPVGEGSGLGLSLCDTIVTAHGGELKIESEEGKGTRVHVFLPLDLNAQESGDDEPVGKMKVI